MDGSNVASKVMQYSVWDLSMQLLPFLEFIPDVSGPEGISSQLVLSFLHASHNCTQKRNVVKEHLTRFVHIAPKISFAFQIHL